MLLNPHHLPDHPYSRIISVVPSITELLFTLGLDSEVIGITKFCVHPTTWHSQKTRVGGTKSIHLQAVSQLSPDLIIANKEENEKEEITALAEKYDVLVTEVSNLEGALTMIDDIGNLTGKKMEAVHLMDQIRNRFDKLVLSQSKQPKMKAAYFIWKNPYMVAGGGTFIHSMMNYCGLENCFNDQDRYPVIHLHQLAEKGCRLLLLSSEPYPFQDKHRQELQDQFPDMKVLLCDGEMFSWYGSRMLEAPDYFQRLLTEL